MVNFLQESDFLMGYLSLFIYPNFFYYALTYVDKAMWILNLLLWDGELAFQWKTYFTHQFVMPFFPQRKKKKFALVDRIKDLLPRAPCTIQL